MRSFLVQSAADVAAPRGFGDSLASAGGALADRLAAYLPSVFAALVLLLLGWLVAHLLKLVAARAVLLLDTLLSRLGLPASVARTHAGRGSTVVGALVFWGVLLAFAAAAAQALGLHAFTDWLSRLVHYLPTLIVGLVILAAGWVLATIVGELAEAAATQLAMAQRRSLGRIVRATIIAGAVLIAADQVGVRITFLAIFAAAVALTLGGGVAIAVGLGAREHVANLIAAHHLRDAFAVGQWLRVGGHEGRLLEINATGFVIESAEGRTVLPARLLAVEAVTVLSKSGDG
jgi:hypothetical protein